MIATLKNGDFITKDCKIGFSWTIFFFGAITLMVRGMWAPAIISIITLGAALFYYIFAGNRLYIEKLISEGFEPIDERSRDILKGYLSSKR